MLIFLLTAPSNRGRVKLISDIEDGRLIPANEDNQSIIELLRSPRASSTSGRPVLISFDIRLAPQWHPKCRRRRSSRACSSGLCQEAHWPLFPVVDAFFARPPKKCRQDRAGAVWVLVAFFLLEYANASEGTGSGNRS